MTKLIKYAGAEVADLQPIQQHMIADIATAINGDVERTVLTPAQALEALERLVVIFKRRVKG